MHAEKIRVTGRKLTDKIYYHHTGHIGGIRSIALNKLLDEHPERALQFARHVRRTAGENIAEYLQEEGRDLVNKTELEEFLRGVDELRETADRIEARLGRLEARLKGAA